MANNQMFSKRSSKKIPKNESTNEFDAKFRANIMRSFGRGRERARSAQVAAVRSVRRGNGNEEGVYTTSRRKDVSFGDLSKQKNESSDTRHDQIGRSESFQEETNQTGRRGSGSQSHYSTKMKDGDTVAPGGHSGKERKDVGQNEGGSPLAISSSHGFPNMSELMTEFDKQLRSRHRGAQTEIEAQLPSSEDALRPLVDAVISREDFASMARSLLSNTARFKNYRDEILGKDQEMSNTRSKNYKAGPISQPAQEHWGYRKRESPPVLPKSKWSRAFVEDEEECVPDERKAEQNPPYSPTLGHTKTGESDPNDEMPTKIFHELYDNLLSRLDDFLSPTDDSGADPDYNSRFIVPHRPPSYWDNYITWKSYINQFTKEQNPTLEPPVTKATLSEVDVNKILQNPKLRHDVNFDPDLHFRPNLGGEKGRRKTRKANDFWETMRTQLQDHVMDREQFEKNLGTADWCELPSFQSWRAFLEQRSSDLVGYNEKIRDYWKERVEKMLNEDGKNEPYHKINLLRPDQLCQIDPLRVNSRLGTRSKGFNPPAMLHTGLQESPRTIVNSDEEFGSNNDEMKMDSQVFGWRKIEDWKAGPGRMKDWRHYSYTKVATKRQKSSYGHSMRKPPSRAIKVLDYLARSLESGGSTLKVALPAVALKSRDARLSTKCVQSKSGYINTSDLFATRSKYVKMRAARRFLLDDIPGVDVGHTGNRRRRSHAAPQFQDNDAHQTQPDIAQNTHAHAQPNHANLAVKFHTPGKMLRYPFRLMEHIRTEPHGEVYSLENYETGVRYETKVYILKGIHPNQRKRRVNNLKNITALPSFLISFDFHGKKYCIFQHSVPDMGTMERGTSSISRFNETAFPKLPPPATQPALVTRREYSAISKSQESCTAATAPEAISRELLFDMYLNDLEFRKEFDDRIRGGLLQHFEGGIVKVNTSWQEMGRSILHERLALSHENIPAQKKSRRGRKKRRVVACDTGANGAID